MNHPNLLIEAHEKLELARRRLELILSVCRETWKDGNTRLGTIEHEAEHCLWQLPSPVADGPGAADKPTEYQQVAALVCLDLDLLYDIAEQPGTTLVGLRAQVKLAHKDKEQYINDPAARERRYAAGCHVFGAVAAGLVRSDVVSGGPGAAERSGE